MESSVSTVDAVVRPWRRATFVAGIVAAVELVALIAIGVVFLGPAVFDRTQSGESAAPQPVVDAKAAERPAPATVASHRAQSPIRPKLARTETSVLILNGNGVAGAAATEAEAIRSRGYLVAAVGNAARSDYRRSLVMYRPGHAGEAKRLGRDLGIRLVTPLDGLRRSQLMGAHVAVVIGAK